MKTILKYIVLPLVLLLCGTAQTKAEFRYAVTAGAGISTLDFKQDLFKVSGIAGPQLGVHGELMFPGIGLGIDVAAYYAMLGAKCDLGSRKIWAVDGYGNENIFLHTLEIPLNLKFKWTRMNGFEDYLAPMVFGGPVFNFNIAHSGCKAMEYPFGSIGLRAGVGVEIFKKWQVSGSYTWGMTYATKAVKLDNMSARNRYWSIRVAYYFK